MCTDLVSDILSLVLLICVAGTYLEMCVHLTNLKKQFFVLRSVNFILDIIF